jgi:hypothetical protein
MNGMKYYWILKVIQRNFLNKSPDLLQLSSHSHTHLIFQAIRQSTITILFYFFHLHFNINYHSKQGNILTQEKC